MEDVLGRACVVVVDDDPASVALLSDMLHYAGVGEVHGVTDPMEAASRCLTVGADLVVLDLHMDGMDGYAVMAALGDLLPDDTFLPVLVLTADTATVARDQALAAGAKDFLVKPVDYTEVLLRVRNLLETHAIYEDLQRHYAALADAESQRAAADLRKLEAERITADRIEDSLSQEALTMVFQPIADLVTGEVVGAEALARFRCEPQRPPDEWFHEAASIGRGTELELAAVRAALRELDELPPDVFMSVNISPAMAVRPELLDLLRQHPGDRVVLELTEHVRVDDYDALLSALMELRAWGLRIAVDDAGAGYSGLRHILRLRPDIIKLDLELTRDIDTDPARRALALALVTFAGEMGATIIAEGIETHEEMASLRSLGIRWGQGFHLAHPGAPLASERLGVPTESA